MEDRLFGLDVQLLFDAFVLFVVIMIMYAIMSRLFFKPVRAFLEQRKQAVAADRDEAQQLQEAAEVSKAAYEEKLKAVQALMAEGHEGARRIYETIGVYFGYAVAYYAMFYDIKHVLLLGRVSSGEGGNIILDFANKTLKAEFPELAEKISVSLPDEKSRRVGQSVAAASLPNIN